MASSDLSGEEYLESLGISLDEVKLTVDADTHASVTGIFAQVSLLLLYYYHLFQALGAKVGNFRALGRIAGFWALGRVVNFDFLGLCGLSVISGP